MMKNLLPTIASLCLCLASLSINAQQSVGIGTTTPHVSSVLDLSSTAKGLLIPRMTTAERNAIAAPAIGLLVYDVSMKSVMMYNGAVWIRSLNESNDAWDYFSGEGTFGELYRSGDVALGNIQDPDGHGLNVQSYTNAKAAVRGTDQSGFNIFAEGMLGVLTPGGLGIPVNVVNIGVLGIKPRLGGNGAAVYGWNTDDNFENYAGLFYADGPTSGTNYGIYARADSATTNYAAYLDGDAYVAERLLGSKGSFSLSATPSEGDATLIGSTDPNYSKLLVAPSTTVNDSSAIWLGEDNDGSFSMGWLYDGNQNKLRAFTDGELVTADYNHLVIQRDGGEIAINTETFAAGYQVSINGKMACEEVLVQNDAAWPDYVFESDYKLMPLKDLEKEIAAKKHLPGIPSAKEIEENGLLMGDIQRRMMEKIEELTLYIIDQNKTIEDQEERIARLEALLRTR